MSGWISRRFASVLLLGFITGCVALDSPTASNPYDLERLKGSAAYENGRYLLLNPVNRGDYLKSIELLE